MLIITCRETIHQKYTLTELMKSIEFSKNKLYTYRSASNCIVGIPYFLKKLLNSFV
jgi:hypothetical protein